MRLETIEAFKLVIEKTEKATDQETLISEKIKRILQSVITFKRDFF